MTALLSKFPLVEAALLLDATVLATGGVAICSGTAFTHLWTAQAQSLVLVGRDGKDCVPTEG